MRVRVKKGDYSPATAGIITIIVFLTISFIIFYKAFSVGSIQKMLEKSALDIIFALVFFCYGILFLFFMIKPCAKYKGKLIYKTFEEYKGKRILVMKFKLLGNNSSMHQEYSCYTTKENDLIIDKCYEIFVKEFNWKIKRIGNEIQEKTYENDISNEYDATNLGLYIAFLGPIMIFSSILLLAIIGLFIYPEYWFSYTIVILFFTIPSVILYYDYKKHK